MATKLYAHFPTYVPHKVRALMYDITKAVEQKVLPKLANEMYGEPQIYPIYGIPQDGYVPFQDGGFEVVACWVNELDTSNLIHPEQKALNEQKYQKMLLEFAEEELGLTEENAKLWISEDCPLEAGNEDIFDDWMSGLFDSVPRTHFEIFVDRGENGDKFIGNTELHVDQKISYILYAILDDSDHSAQKVLAEGSMKIQTLIDLTQSQCEELPEFFVHSLDKKVRNCWGMYNYNNMIVTSSN